MTLSRQDRLRRDKIGAVMGLFLIWEQLYTEFRMKTVVLNIGSLGDWHFGSASHLW